MLEDRYIVLKRTDLKGLLAQEEYELHCILRKVRLAREARGAGPLQCVVIEKDWPEYDEVTEMLYNRISNQ